jgi:hypothetical protein
MTKITCLDDVDDSPASVATTRRCRVVAGFLARTDGREIVEPAEADLATVVAALADRGVLHFRPTGEPGVVAVDHVPSEAVVRTATDGLKEWPSSVANRMAKSARRSAGALFTFPAESGDDAIEVFITDWSPCPGACAVAVHHGHPYVRGRVAWDDRPSWFTGLYVRHPLTGDLLPVWVADWVKPDFGTGAVLVNPAHDAVDLEFGRTVGMPIRFALMPTGASDSPESWPAPPVIKQGTAIKTGRWDGMNVADARTAYRETLGERGLAKDHTDVRLPGYRIGTLTIDEGGPWRWTPEDGRLAPAGDGDGGGRRARLEPAPVLAAAAAVVGGAEVVMMGATAVKSAAPLLVTLLKDGGVERMPAVQVTQTADYGGSREYDDALRLAYLVAGDPNQPATIKEALLEQTERFLAGLGEMKERLAEVGEAPPKGVASALDRGDPVALFRELYRWQKDTLKSGKPVEERSYRAAVSALLGDTGF